MSFNPFKFTYNPPITVEGTNPSTNTVVTTANTTPINTTAAQIKAASKSTDLINKLSALQQTNAYIQQVIKEATANTVITLDPNTDAAVSAALQQVYAQVPSGVSINMYSNLLDADITSQLLSSTLTGSANQVNQVQQASISTINTFVDNALLNDITYSSQLPLLLRSLKVDQAIFDSLSTNLATYPVQSIASTATLSSTSTIAAKSLDVDDDLYNFLNGVTNDAASNYAAIYQVAATAATINNDITAVTALFVEQPLADLARIVGLINGAKGLFYKDLFGDLVKDLGNFVYAKLVLDASAIVFAADKLTQMAISPLKSIGGSLVGITSKVTALTKLAGTVPTGNPLAGISKSSSCSGSSVSSSPSFKSISAQAGTSSLTKGVTDAVFQLNWLQSKITAKTNTSLQQFKKVLGRRIASQSSHTNLLCSLKSAEALSNVASTLINKSTGTNSAPIISSTLPITSVVSSASPTVQSTLVSGGLTL